VSYAKWKKRKITGYPIFIMDFRVVSHAETLMQPSFGKVLAVPPSWNRSWSWKCFTICFVFCFSFMGENMAEGKENKWNGYFLNLNSAHNIITIFETISKKTRHMNIKNPAPFSLNDDRMCIYRTMPSKRFLNHLMVSDCVMRWPEPMWDWQRLRLAIRSPGRVMQQ